MRKGLGAGSPPPVIVKSLKIERDTLLFKLGISPSSWEDVSWTLNALPMSGLMMRAMESGQRLKPAAKVLALGVDTLRSHLGKIC
mmetsp:Transcript_43552/g.94906  ORF Transcript_43552/g.94906 Transcript_43552/m.94906 type:complete len:85 (+) Transcript_43552:152-406(+)